MLQRTWVFEQQAVYSQALKHKEQQKKRAWSAYTISHTRNLENIAI